MEAGQLSCGSNCCLAIYERAILLVCPLRATIMEEGATIN